MRKGDKYANDPPKYGPSDHKDFRGNDDGSVVVYVKMATQPENRSLFLAH